MKRLLYKIRMWLLGLLHGEPEECAEKTKDAYMDYIREQRKQISMLVDTIALYKIMRLASRISDLRSRGYDISREMVQGRNRYGEATRYARYTLAEREQNV